MNLLNYINYGMCIYENTVSENDTFKLGDVVINKANEIGVIIQIHEPNEFRTDMFGNCSTPEIRMATDTEITEQRPDLLQSGKFYHPQNDVWAKFSSHRARERASTQIYLNKPIASFHRDYQLYPISPNDWEKIKSIKGAKLVTKLPNVHWMNCI